MQIPTVKAERRTTSGTKHNRKLRAQGMMPGVLYGRGKDNINLTLPSGTIEHLIATDTHVVEIDVEGAKTHAMVRAIQRDSLGSNIEHIDFTRLELDDEVRVNLPLNFVGTARGTQHGGVMQVMRGEIPLYCKARNIPKHLDVDVTHLEVDDMLRYKDIKLPEGAKLAANPEWVVTSCREPRVIVETVATPDAAAAAAPGAPGAAPAAAGAAAPAAAGAKGAAAPAAAGAKGAAPAAAAAPAKGAPAKK